MSPTTVLVVDDDVAIIEFIEMALTDQGYRVLSAVNGAALALARAAQPNLILLDLMMPEMDGIEVSRRLRADPTTAAIPIVMMSAQERLDQVRFLPVNDRLAKPFALQHLYAMVARWAAPA